MSTLLLTALLALMPHSQYTACIERRFAVIATQAQAAQVETGVPAGVLLVVGFMESHLGCNPRSGGCWGAPVDVRHRGTAGTPNHAAVALARSYVVCGSWRRAVARFRTGLCVAQPEHAAYVRVASGLIARVYARAGIAAPDLR